MKDILKKHYEKAILAALALGFVFALLYLLQMLESAAEVKPEDLRFHAPRGGYKVQNFADKSFKINYQLGEQSVWDGREDSSKLGFNAELLVPMKSLRCMHKDCKKIIPWVIAQGKLSGENAGKRICPHCERELPDPGEPKDYASEIARRDSDNDGMPDRYERRMGFKLDDPKDAEEDRDGDGFSNLYEFMVGTDPNDKENFPSLEKCLFLFRMLPVSMPLKLNRVTVIADAADKNSKKNWEINLTVNNTPEITNIGRTFKLKNTTYQIIDAIHNTGDKQTGNVVVNDDKSRIIVAPLVNNKPDMKAKFEIETNKKVYEPEPRVIIRDVRFFGKKKGVHRVRKGDTFEVSSEDGSKVRYMVKATDLAKSTVTLEDVDKGESFILTKQARIPKNAYVKKDGENNNNDNDNNRRRRPARRRRR